MVRKIKWLLKIMGSLFPSRVRVFFMRRRGAVIGKGVRLGPLSVFECGKIIMGEGCHIGAFTRLKVRGTLEFGNDVKIGYLTRINAAGIKLGDETVLCSNVAVVGVRRRSVLTTGPRCYVGDSCVIDLFNPVTLGEEVGIGGFSRLYTHGSWQSELDGFPIASAEAHVGDFSWIGAGATILAGVEIGDYATVGGGTVMRRRIPSYSLATGNPGKVVLQNGAHLVHVPEEDRFNLCRRMVLEVADHQDWLDGKVETEESEDSCRVSSEEGVLMFRRCFSGMEKVSAVISFERMSDALILEFEAAGIDWFDMDRRRCSRGKTGLSPLIRGIFSNHGVRFLTTGRGEIAGATDKRRGRKPELPGGPAADRI